MLVLCIFRNTRKMHRSLFFPLLNIFLLQKIYFFSFFKNTWHRNKGEVNNFNSTTRVSSELNTAAIKLPQKWEVHWKYVYIVRYWFQLNKDICWSAYNYCYAFENQIELSKDPFHPSLPPLTARNTGKKVRREHTIQSFTVKNWVKARLWTSL